MADEGGKPEDGKKVVHIYPLVKNCDMVEDMKNEAIELIVTACEKHQSNNEMAAKVIKDNLDQKFGPSWHAVVGEGFGFNISYECKSLLYLFFGGNIGICIWKC
ncbi:dynein light chain 4, axonemal [Cimex lectularius]|uniref:Dynein light chain n=1 Tax=Cimex lectularius TaxID=79782 RepID=A0A8I6RI63_CIMLE|nr:dynein light chain 4, axonemal [Cimex lectularius]